MPHIRVLTTLELTNEKSILPVSIRIRNCQIDLPNRIYKKLLKYTPKYKPDELTSHFFFYISESLKFMRTAYEIEGRFKYNDHEDIPYWLIPYILNLSNYTFIEFMHPINVGPQFVNSGSTYATSLAPKFQCFNHCQVHYDENHIFIEEFLSFNGVYTANILMSTRVGDSA